jgi:hypothetical protein
MPSHPCLMSATRASSKHRLFLEWLQTFVIVVNSSWGWEIDGTNRSVLHAVVIMKTPHGIALTKH